MIYKIRFLSKEELVRKVRDVKTIDQKTLENIRRDIENYSSFYDYYLDIPPEDEVEVFYLKGTKHELYIALSRSICMCFFCTNSDRDMVYIPEHKSWYCIECQDQDLMWYRWRGSEEDRRQNDYINWYYEEKEKFTRRFLCKKNKVQKA